MSPSIWRSAGSSAGIARSPHSTGFLSAITRSRTRGCKLFGVKHIEIAIRASIPASKRPEKGGLHGAVVAATPAAHVKAITTSPSKAVRGVGRQTGGLEGHPLTYCPALMFSIADSI